MIFAVAWIVSGAGILASGLADATPATQPVQRVALGADGGLVFSSEHERLSVTSLHGTDKQEWIAQAPDKSSLWRLALRGPKAATVEWASADLPLTRVEADTAKARFTWATTLGAERAEVHLLVRSEAGSDLSQWQLAASLPDGWSVARADWPILPNLRLEPELKMAAPFGWGLEYDVKAGMSYAGTYPSLVASMPFVAFYARGHGLYVGCHDQQGHHKHLSVKAGQDAANVTFTHWPCEADSAGGRYAPAFHVVVGSFRGDYWDAAQIYRAFSLTAPWGKPRFASQTSKPATEPPDWLRNIEVWLMPGAEPLKNVEACRKAAAFFGVPIGLHWYNWHEIPFDTLYPDYFPAKPGFREGVKALQAIGFRVMPYINGRLCDPKSKTWTQEGADKAAARNDKGETYTEVYGSKVPLHVMCPATRQWQDKIASIVDRLVNECGVDGVYIDQIAAAGAVRCSNPDHGHSVGGGTFWFDGYRAMLNQIREHLPKDRILTTEENAECWNEQFDALLMVNTSSGAGRRIIPLMPSVYAGRVITFGFQYIAGDDISKSLPFRAKMARAFLWGAQLGWISVDSIMADNARIEAEFLRNLARVRQDGHEFLLNGRFLGEVEVTGDNPRLTGEGSGSQKYPIELPAVMATAWLAPESSVVLVVVNLSDQARAVEIRPPWQRAAEASLAPSEAITGNEPSVVKLTIPARDGRIVRVKTRESNQ